MDRQARGGGVLLPKGSLLFHGTPEAFGGRLRPGIDGLVWFADCPAIAQLYIPMSGGSMLVSPEHLVYPSQDRETQTLQKYIGIDYDLDDVKWENYRPKSFPLPKGWKNLPTKADVVRLMGRKGWEPRGSGGYEVLLNGNRIVPPGKKIPGRLFVCKTKRDMYLWGKSTGSWEGDLMDVDYHDIRGFRDAEKAGLDGVLIDDYAQSEEWGNFGHKSVGLFDHALKDVSCKATPATYQEWERNPGTPEYPNPPPMYFHKLGSRTLAQRMEDTAKRLARIAVDIRSVAR